MQRPRKARSNRLKVSEGSKKLARLKAVQVDNAIDEGYSSGNPPPPTTPSTKSPKQTKKIEMKEPVSTPTMSKSNLKVNPTTSKPKAIDESETDRERVSNPKPARPVTEQSSVRPKPLLRSESRTFVFVYDEDAKTSKPVSAPDNLNVEVPVLLQYELTEDALEKCLETSEFEDKQGRGDGNNNMTSADGANDKFCSPTERLLLSREKDELKNKGMHVVKWLINLKEHGEEMSSASKDITGPEVTS